LRQESDNILDVAGRILLTLDFEFSATTFQGKLKKKQTAVIGDQFNITVR